MKQKDRKIRNSEWRASPLTPFDLLIFLSIPLVCPSEGLEVRHESLRHDDALDLPGPFEDVVDLDVAEPLLEELMLRRDGALGAADLDGVDARPDRRLPRHRLAAARLLRVRLTLIREPRRVPRRHARRGQPAPDAR